MTANNMGDTLITVRPFQAGDAEQLSRLQEKRLLFTFEPEFWQWKYANAPGGQQLAVVAVSSRRIVGAAGAMPARLKVGDQIWMGSKDGDYFIEEEYRPAGTFFHLIRLAVQLKKKQGITFSFGVPVEQVKEFEVSLLGCTEIGKINKYVKLLNTPPFLSGRLKKWRWLVRATSLATRATMRIYGLPWNGRESRYSVSEVHHFDGSFDHFWSVVSRSCCVGFVRDSEYLNWRFVAIPGIKYTILKAEENGIVRGYVVLRMYKNTTLRRGCIMDVLAEDVAAFQDLIRAALVYFQSRGADIVVFWFLGPAEMTRVLRKQGFFHRPLDRALVLKANRPEFPMEIARDANNWYVTMADCDVF